MLFVVFWCVLRDVTTLRVRVCILPGNSFRRYVHHANSRWPFVRLSQGRYDGVCVCVLSFISSSLCLCVMPSTSMTVVCRSRRGSSVFEEEDDDQSRARPSLLLAQQAWLRRESGGSPKSASACLLGQSCASVWRMYICIMFRVWGRPTCIRAQLVNAFTYVCAIC